MRNKTFIIKRLCFVLIVFLLLFCAVSCKGKDNDGTEYLIFHLQSDDTYSVMISSDGAAKSKEIAIPEVYNEKPVTKIQSFAFENAKMLESVTIPCSITEVGNNAFKGCGSLTTVYWNSIACESVYNNYSISPFYGCDNLKSVVFGNKVEAIPGMMLGCFSGLKSIIIPDSVTSIGDYAFSDCIGLSSVTIPDSVTSMGHGAFNGCTGLTSVTIGNNVTSIGDGAFSGCSGLTSVAISDSVASIGGYAFRDCIGLTNVTIPDSVTAIGVSAFRGCSGLTSVTIGNNVMSIGDGAFSGCSGLTSIHISDLAAWCQISGLWNLMEYGSTSKKLYINNEIKTEIIIPEEVTSIGAYAFYGCAELTSVTIPDSVTSIGSFAFV